ncbi:MAG: polysaccharide deacetylase family protein [Candidatus Binataceae bacterium]
MEVALKVDVDTHQGLGEGVPRLQRLLTTHGVTATFFIAMGPDNSGRAVMRLLRNPGFIAKMRRTRAVSMYGLRTILSGTLLPARQIARAFPEIIRELMRAGFEVGVHGYDHVRWQDRLDAIGEAGIGAEIDQAFALFDAIAGAPATCFAAPGWRTNGAALAALDTRQLHYRSDTRGRSPYRCKLGGRVLATPEIPTTWPTLDEILGTPALAAAGSIPRFYLGQLRDDALNVHTIHAETEGMGQLEAFSGLIDALKARGARFVKLGDVAAQLDAKQLPLHEVIRTTLPGRAGWISAQAP